MVIDAAKGIEAQTRKLFEVCRLRDIPIMTFVNKMDREARDPLELLDEICRPAPARMRADGLAGRHGPEFPRHDRSLCGEFRAVRRQRARRRQRHAGVLPRNAPSSTRTSSSRAPACRASTTAPIARATRRRSISARRSRISACAICSSALAENAPPPRPGRAKAQAVEPVDTEVTGFVFKVQANMDPNHRDRVAFLRLASGKFRRGMKLTQSGTAQDHRRAQPDPVLRPGARDGGRGVSRRHHRHPQPRRPCASATRCRNWARWSSPASRTSRRKSCAACASAIR